MNTDNDREGSDCPAQTYLLAVNFPFVHKIRGIAIVLLLDRMLLVGLDVFIVENLGSLYLVV